MRINRQWQESVYATLFLDDPGSRAFFPRLHPFWGMTGLLARDFILLLPSAPVHVNETIYNVIYRVIILPCLVEPGVAPDRVEACGVLHDHAQQNPAEKHAFVLLSGVQPAFSAGMGYSRRVWRGTGSMQDGSAAALDGRPGCAYFSHQDKDDDSENDA